MSDSFPYRSKQQAPLSISLELFQQMKSLAERDKSSGVQSLFLSDPDRVDNFSYQLDMLYFDLSKTHISPELLEAYLEFAKDVDLEDKRAALFEGYRINQTEDRAVLHPLLRDSDNQGIPTYDPVYLEEARAAKDQFYRQYNTINDQLQLRTTAVTDIIHVGIGGSSLGTQLCFEALKQSSESIRIHFIGNIDGHQLVEVLELCQPETTLVIGVSKTFTTAETLQNINSIGDWYIANGGTNYLDNVIAVTANVENAKRFGIAEQSIVGFPEWVGGRYSVWSAVSLSAVLVLGIEKFKRFLSGAARVDRYFCTTPLNSNVCFLAASLDHYYANFFEAGSRGIFAYDHRLRFLVNYLQQLETESNGKDRQIDGNLVDQSTAPVVWGGVGTDVQHSVFQLLHQGTALIPSEFLLVKTPEHNLKQHHQTLLANGLAQTAALLQGQSLQTVTAANAENEISDITAKAKIFSGDRPSTTVLLDKLTPEALGSLLAFYEHRTFCFGLLTNVNSFDQMGVELGKRLAAELEPYLTGEGAAVASDNAPMLDPSTAKLVAMLNE